MEVSGRLLPQSLSSSSWQQLISLQAVDGRELVLIPQPVREVIDFLSKRIREVYKETLTFS